MSDIEQTKPEFPTTGGSYTRDPATGELNKVEGTVQLTDPEHPEHPEQKKKDEE